mgnify:CR=1 FL=1
MLVNLRWYLDKVPIPILNCFITGMGKVALLIIDIWKSNCLHSLSKMEVVILVSDVCVCSPTYQNMTSSGRIENYTFSVQVIHQ